MHAAIRLTAALACAAGAAAYEIGGPISDVRLHGGIQMAPKVKEISISHQQTLPNGVAVAGTRATNATEMDWGETRRANFFLGADYVRGSSSGRRGAAGLLWGAGLHYATMNMAPDSYTVNGVNYATKRQPKGLDFHEFGGAVQLAYATRPRETDFGEYHLEFGGFGRGGPMKGTVESELYKGTAATGYYTETIRVNDWGWWWAAGPQVGFYLVDKGWMVGVNAEWAIGSGRINFDALPNGDTSEVTLTRNGVGGSLIIGGRF